VRHDVLHTLDCLAVDVATVVTAFATVFLAELPDKTMLSTIVLSARFHRPLAVWIGAASALTLQMVIAVTAGQLLGLLPERPVRFGVAALFAIGAVVLWRSHDEDGDDFGDASARSERRDGMTFRRIAATTFGVVFVAEWGDLTQLATASLATTRPPASVLVGAVAAMLSVTAIGVLFGRALLRVVPPGLLHRLAAVVFGVLAVLFFVSAVRTIDLDTGIEPSAGAPITEVQRARP
jgi:putative Ca2+/H+ antiporter (TMEM165/GDT1 family)